MVDIPEHDGIRGMVAQILNARELVLNRGSEHSVEVGMRFAVLNSRGADIKDPETGELIGSVDVPKVLVKVVRVGEKVSVASTFRKFTTGNQGLIAGLSGLYATAVTRVETLRTDEATYQEEINPGDSFVHIGDPVVQVRGEEFSGWGMGSE
jgi:hypothetical protein